MGKSSLGTIIAVCLVLLVVFAGYAIYSMGKPASITTTTTTTGVTTGGAAVAGVSCPSDGTTNGQVKYQESLASTITYGNPTCYFMPLTAGYKRVAAGTLQTDGTYSTAVDLTCTNAGTRWKVVCVGKQDAYTSTEEVVSFVAEGNAVQRDVVGKAADRLQVRVLDKIAGAATYLNETLISANANTGAYVALNGSTATFANGIGSSTLTLGTDGYMDLAIYVKTNNTKKQFGEDGLKTLMVVDAGTAVWSEPIVSRDSGSKLSSSLAIMSEDDRRAFSGYEYAYDIGSFNDRESKINFYMQAASGINPGASDAPIIAFCAESRYNSVKSVDTIKVGCYTDASSQALVAMSVAQKMTITVA